MIILTFTDPRATDLNLAGGKGANLARLSLAGFPVPAGFILPATLYRELFGTPAWQSQLALRLKDLETANPDALEAASLEIRKMVAATPLPERWEKEILGAYQSLGNGLVAVRSSATAEDLPDLSFAGQQDTYLNISGESDLLRAIRNCWASLWTARAIGYRARNQVAGTGLALAVVVQRMVPSEISGVLFTANPLTGNRKETVIDAIPGLGEALVSGQIEPDHYVVETASGKLLTSQFGSRHLGAEGGVERESNRLRLNEEQIGQLTALGSRVAAAQSGPQDIEWAFADGTLHLLQARPITSLYPVPDTMLDGPKRILFSFGSMQGLLDPMTAIGQDTFQHVICGMGGVFGFRALPETQQALLPAGERLWFNITTPYRHTLGRKLILGALGFIDPAAKLTLLQIADDQAFAPRGHTPPPALVLQLLLHVPPVLFRVFRYMIRPQPTLNAAILGADNFLFRIEKQCAGSADANADLLRRVKLISQNTTHLPPEIPALVTGLMAGMVSFTVFRILGARLIPELRAQIPTLSLEALRGIPNNVTTEMDLALFATSRRILADPAGREQMNRMDARSLSEEYLAGRLAAPTQTAIAEFMGRYGMRGLAEIDMGRPRWREDPTPVVQSLQSYLAIEDGPFTPDRVFARGSDEAEKVLETIFTAVRKKPLGRIKEHMLRFFAGRMRALMGIRESPKFLIIRMMGFIREGFLESGHILQQAGVFHQADDIFFLHMREMESIANGNTNGWKSIVAERRSRFGREMRRRRIPRILLSDGRAYFESAPTTNAASANALTGDPVSPGMIEGRVRVILDPRGARLEAGEILVCPGTDPSWTPLFLSAGGLVMEVGGMMTHGSVVAREYGIPAVVGVDFATEKLKTGDLVRVDGTRGIVEILPQKA